MCALPPQASQQGQVEVHPSPDAGDQLPGASALEEFRNQSGSCSISAAALLLQAGSDHIQVHLPTTLTNAPLLGMLKWFNLKKCNHRSIVSLLSPWQNHYLHKHMSQEENED